MKKRYFIDMKCLGKKVIALASLLLCVTLVFPQTEKESKVLTLEDAVESALNNNITIKQSSINLAAKKREKTFSWNSVSPEISLDGSYSLPLPDSDDEKTRLYGGASLSLGLSPSVYTSVRGAGLEYSLQELVYANDVRSIELEVRKNYYSLLYEIEQIGLQEKSFETSKNQYESNLAKYNRGTLSRLDVLSAEVSYQNDGLQLKSLRTSLENDMASFKQLIGLPQETEVSLIGSFDSVLELQEVSIEGIEISSFDVLSLEKELAGAKNSLLASRFTAYGPSLSASYSYGYDSSDYGSSWDDSGTLSFKATIPLDGWLPWSSGSMSVKSKKDSVADLELQLEDAKTSLDVNVSVLLNRIHQILEDIELRKNSIALAQTTYEMTLEAYNHGTRDLLSLQSSSDDLFSAKVSLLSEAYNLKCALLDLENTIGVPFGTLEERK